LEVVPSEIDFGLVSQGDTVQREVRLSEMPSDHFVIEKVDAGAMPVQCTLSPVTEFDGIKGYRIQLTLEVGTLESGDHTGELKIHTTSDLRPVVVVPIRFRVKSFAEVTPRIVAFGSTSLGRGAPRRVHVSSTDGSPVKVKVLKTPRDWNVLVHEKGNTADITIEPTFSKPGLWQEVVELQVQSGSREEKFVLQCAGYVRPQGE
jgi:hypothetical protein